MWLNGGYLSRYHGIFNFLRRLMNQSPENVNGASIEPWFATHPNGRVIVYFDDVNKVVLNQVEFVQAYKGSAIGIVNCEL